ncbi:MAG: AmpG family muropeptide MFS transporter [Gammaproteobacteria bacterium]|nr:AmpG family muropeptide MFS transporter [Gammaproteobacteria bacterium]
MTTKTEQISWSEALKVYKQPKVIAMLFLGFSAGLPLFLVFGTLSIWLRREGIDRSTIGFVSWVTLLYGLKFLWAPLVDRLPLPILTTWLGQRRSWMLLAQIGVLVGLLMMASTAPSTHLTTLVVAALIVAFSSATQDISIDAWRIEAVSINQQGAMAGTYQLGYRLGLILAGGGATIIAGSSSWNTAYFIMGCSMLVGMITTFIITEPERKIGEQTWEQEQRVVKFLEGPSRLPDGLRNIIAWFIGAVVCPFVDFFARNGTAAILILLFIGLFRISDITMGVMSGPLYVDMGFTDTQIGLVSKTFGIAITIFGALLGGVLVMRYGIMRMLIISAILVVLTNLLFAWLATQGPEIALLALVITADNLSGGIAGSAFIAYLSSLTNRAYTATQYALFSSLMLLPAKFIGGFSVTIVDDHGYIYFFIYAGLLGIPAILLATYLWRKNDVLFETKTVTESQITK